MMGMQPSAQEQALFSYRINLEQRVRPDHPLRQLHAILDLSFVLPAVAHCYGRSGNVSVDPRVILKMMLLLFYYNIPSERELMAQISERLDFLWFLGYDLETAIPDHSVLSKARARWGTEVFEALFCRTVEQCVQAGLVDGRLLHVDSTTLKANASKDSVIKSSPELVSALRQAYQEQERKLEQSAPAKEDDGSAGNDSAEPPAPEAQEPTSEGKRAEVNRTHISLTDPEAQIARIKTGVSELSYKEHRLVDDAKGVITAIKATVSTVGDGSQLPGLVQHHRSHTELKLAEITVAGDHHYGTASNYLFCAQEGIRPHLAQASAHPGPDKLALKEFIYEPDQDRVRCPAGHYLLLHQNKPQEQAKVYLIEDAKLCAQCPLRKRCTTSSQGRSLQRHVYSEQIEQARQQANSVAGRYSRKRRKHVMEGSFADAANNHGAKRARWRGLWRQRVQSWLIAAVQNLRILLRKAVARPAKPALSLAKMDPTRPNILRLDPKSAKTWWWKLRYRVEVGLLAETANTTSFLDHRSNTAALQNLVLGNTPLRRLLQFSDSTRLTHWSPSSVRNTGARAALRAWSPRIPQAFYD